MKGMKKTPEEDRAITSLELPETSSNMAEKEARRLRRVLANRESARQTIRRRQALFEALTRKAVDLAVENDNLKKDKELAKKEYESLKSTNDCLKSQMAIMMKAEVEIEEKSKSSNSEISTSAPATPSFPYNLNSTVLFNWPMFVPPSDASPEQCRSESGIATPLLPMMQLWKPDSCLNQGNSVMLANPGTLLYVLPFPCFFPFHAPGSASQCQSSELNDKQNQTSAGHHCNTSFSSKQMLNSESSLPLKVKTEVLNSTGSTSTEDPDQPGFSFLQDGSGDGEGIVHNAMVLMPAQLNCIRPIASVGPFTALHQDDIPNIGPAATAGEHNAENLSHGKQEAIIQPSKKPADAITAAEARKRRKELIKLKTSMHINTKL